MPLNEIIEFTELDKFTRLNNVTNTKYFNDFLKIRR